MNCSLSKLSEGRELDWLLLIITFYREEGQYLAIKTLANTSTRTLPLYNLVLEG
jgi:hypothetical protein